MSNIIFVNNFSTTLAGAISTTSTTANLASGAGASLPTIPSGDYLVMTFIDAATGLLNEIVWVTAVSGDAITIVRAKEGTAAQSWSAEDIATSLPTAGGLGKIQATGGILCTDTGAVNAMVVTTDVPVPVYFAGLVLNVVPAYANTGAATINANGLGVISILSAGGTSLTGGEFSVGVPTRIICGSASGSFYLTTKNLTVTANFEPTASATIAPSADFTTVVPSITAAATITITGGSKVGQSVRVYGNGSYAVTVASSVSTGSPIFVFPDNSTSYSVTIPISFSAYIDLIWDGTNWRANTQGIISVVGAAGPAITLTNLVNGGVAPLNSPYLITPYTNSTPGPSDNSARIPNTDWLYSGCLTVIAAALGFVFSPGNPGYIKFPNFLGGFVVQWGQNSVGAPSQVTFPIAFPHAALGLVVSEADAEGSWGAANPTVHGYDTLSTTGYHAWAESWNGSGWTGGSIAQSYVAIGY